MAKAIIILAVIATAYGAVLKNEGVPLQRVARSPCSTCGPPPLPLLHTQNWSGLARSSDGLQNTVFSGAAAAAADQGPAAVGEAFSLASSSAGAGLGGSANSGLAATGSSGDGIGSSGSNGVGLSGANYGGFSGVKGRYSAGGYGGGRKVSGGGFKESHYSYHGGNKDFGAQGGYEQDGQTAASSSSSSAAQDGSFGGSNKDAFGSSGSGHSGSFTNRGDVNVGETQDQQKGSFSNSNKFQQSSQQDFNTASSSGQSSTYGGNGGHAGNNFDHGFSSGNQKDVSSIESNGREHGQGHFGSGLSSGQEIHQSHSLDNAAGQDNFGPRYLTQNQGRVDEFNDNRGAASQGQFQSGFSSQGKRERYEEQDRFKPHGSYKQGRGFEASESQSSSSTQGGLGSGQYQQSENRGQLQATGSDRRIGQGGFGSLTSSGQQGFISGSGGADAQSALSGALNLASQGLQTSNQAGCSTCGKNSYALSNAKSRTGSAVAVSIGG